MAEALLSIQGLQSGYGDVQVLWDATLEVQAGSIACLVGSNGAGKTTLMRTLSGLVPTRGGASVSTAQASPVQHPKRYCRLASPMFPKGDACFRPCLFATTC